MKQRFSSLDVKVIAHELSASLVSLRLSNVHDLSTRIFLLKFAKPEHKEQLLIDSGFRCHLTSFARTTAAAPSPFVARLRKYLRTRRVTSVSQIGTDRIIDIQFSDGQYRLFLEFYAGGNIVLTDNELNIIALLRNVNEGAEHEQYRVGLKYDLSLRQNYPSIPPLTIERVKDGLQKAVDKQGQDAGQGKKIKKKPGDAIRKALAVSITEYPPVLLDHALQVKGFNKDLQPAEVLQDNSLMEKLMGVFDEAARVMAEITSADTAKGYIYAKVSAKAADEKAEDADKDGEAEAENSGVLYDDFHPFKPCQFEGKQESKIIEFDGFNKTVDDFFSSIEGQKLESKLQEREDAAKRKLEQARQEHERRIGGLQTVQEQNVLKAQAIEANLERVEEATAAVNGLVAQGMDWVEIGKLIEIEQRKHNPVAEMIKLPLKLHENTVTLSLIGWEEQIEEEEMADLTESEPSDSEDEARPAPPKQVESKKLAIDIDLSLSAWSNARQYYDQRKAAAVKQDKTQQASSRALKSTEQKITADLKKGLKQEKAVLRPVRKQMWFEKFVYFISSDGYLVLGGKDAQQNEILYRRYLKKGDIYVHADLHGAASVIIKNNPATPDAPIPPSTLAQAGNLSVCTSGAWDSKAVMSAWWVNADQVSKTAPTGEYLTTGGFMVRGKKNFLPPAQLILGFGIMFQISEDSKARHVKHRLQDTEPESAPGKASQQEQDAALLEAGDDDHDDDDDFPDAENEDHDDEDDFPDVKTEDTDDELPDARDDEGTDVEHDGEHTKQRANPLQSGGVGSRDGGQDAQDKDGDEDEDEDEDDDDADDDEVDGEDGDTVDAEVDTDATSTVPPSIGSSDQPDAAHDEQQSGVRHLSAKQRKLQKKGKPIDSVAESGSTPSTPHPDKQQNTPKQPQPSRGKRAKAKKKANKYANQDEEDRRIAMALLGSKKAEPDAEKTGTDSTAQQETLEEARERRRAQHERAQKQGLEAEEIRRLRIEEGVEELDDDESAQMTGLDQFIGQPMVGDELLEAIPVCAPWAALGKYKYKVKLQPGPQKKGKAVREILGKLNRDFAEPRNIDSKAEDKERIWPREAELIKNWKDVEVFGVVPVKGVRVMMSGAEKGKPGAKGAKGGRGKGSKKAR